MAVAFPLRVDGEVPHALHPLAIRHARWLDAVPGYSLVLHTWSQDPRVHLHVRTPITCGGLDAEGNWRAPARGIHFLFPAQTASKAFRGKFLARLNAAHRSGKLPDDPHRAGCMASPAPCAARA